MYIYVYPEEKMKIRKELADKAVALICNCPAFSGADESEIRYTLASENSVIKEFSKGQAVFPCHGISRAVGFVLTGSCHVCKDKKITALIESGSFFGIENLYGKAQPEFTVSAADSCKVLFLKQAAVDGILRSSADALHSCLGYLSDRINQSQKTAAALSSTSGEKLLAEYLLSRPKNSKNEVELPQDMFKLAKQLNLGKDGLFRAIDKLHSAGAIVFNGRAVCIANEEILAEFID